MVEGKQQVYEKPWAGTKHPGGLSSASSVTTKGIAQKCKNNVQKKKEKIKVLQVKRKPKLKLAKKV